MDALPRRSEAFFLFAKMSQKRHRFFGWCLHQVVLSSFSMLLIFELFL